MAGIGIGIGLALGGGGGGGGGAAGLAADKATYLSSVAAGALIATLTDPYGGGSTFSIVGSSPATLALASSGRIVAGAGAQTPGQASTIVIRATKGSRAIEEPLLFTAVAGETTPAPTTGTVARFSATYNPVANSTLTMNGAKDTAVDRQLYTLAQDRPTIWAAFNGWYLDVSTGYTVIENARPIRAAFWSINGIVKPCLFGGIQGKTINPGDNDIRTDSLAPADFGLTGASFPAGTVIALTVETAYSAMGSKHPYTVAHTLSDRAGQTARQYDRAATTVKLDNVGAVTETGTATTGMIGGYRPFLCGMAPASEKVWAAVGDSLTAGSYDEIPNADGRGWFQMACKAQGWANLNFSVAGSKSSAGRDSANVNYWFAFVNRVVILKGTNDFGPAGTTRRQCKSSGRNQGGDREASTAIDVLDGQLRHKGGADHSGRMGDGRARYVQYQPRHRFRVRCGHTAGGGPGSDRPCVPPHQRDSERLLGERDPPKQRRHPAPTRRGHARHALGRIRP
jgi:hypothetical protein